MACPLTDILNPVDRSPKSSFSSSFRSQPFTQPSTNENKALSSPRKRKRRSPSTDLSTVDSAEPGLPSALTLLPQEGSIYNRRLNSSSKALPVLCTPKKRKLDNFGQDVLPSPQTVRAETVRELFNIFTAILNNPELTFEFSKQLDVEDLISLYAISKDFHYLANKRFTAMILGQTVTKAPESSRIFIFTYYKNLCLRDPNRTQLRSMTGTIRTIPSLRWVRMVLFRERVVDDIVQSLAEQGHRLPARASLVVKKLWFVLDYSDNNRRAATLHSTEYWTPKDLFVAVMFFLKLDMRLTDPVTGHGKTGLRRMLVNQRSFSTLAMVLQRREMKTHVDMVRMMVRYNYNPPVKPRQSVLGVEPQDIGRLQFEGWGIRRTKFIPIEELVFREALKRKLGLHHFYLDMMIYGYINKRTFEDIRTPARESFTGGEGGNEWRGKVRDRSERPTILDLDLFENKWQDSDEDTGEDGDSEVDDEDEDEDGLDYEEDEWNDEESDESLSDTKDQDDESNQSADATGGQ